MSTFCTVTANVLSIIIAGFLLHTKTHTSSHTKSRQHQITLMIKSHSRTMGA